MTPQVFSWTGARLHLSLGAFNQIRSSSSIRQIPPDGWASVDGGLFFAINEGTGKEADIMQVSQCPMPGAFAEIVGNVTAPSCPNSILHHAGRGNPCAVKVNKAVAGSISSVAAHLATASLTDSTPSPTTTGTGNAACYISDPIRSAISVAAAISFLILYSG